MISDNLRDEIKCTINCSVSPGKSKCAKQIYILLTGKEIFLRPSERNKFEIHEEDVKEL